MKYFFIFFFSFIVITINTHAQEVELTFGEFSSRIVTEAVPEHGLLEVTTVAYKESNGSNLSLNEVGVSGNLWYRLAETTDEYIDAGFVYWSFDDSLKLKAWIDPDVIQSNLLYEGYVQLFLFSGEWSEWYYSDTMSFVAGDSLIAIGAAINTMDFESGEADVEPSNSPVFDFFVEAEITFHEITELPDPLASFPVDYTGEFHYRELGTSNWQIDNCAMVVYEDSVRLRSVLDQGDYLHDVEYECRFALTATSLAEPLARTWYSDTTLFTIESVITSTGDADTEESFSVYPNPTNGEVTVTGLHDVDDMIWVHDMTGKRVHSVPVSSRSQSLDLSHLPSGVYILEATSPQGVRHKRLSKL